jgi:uncharacterized protein (TIGR03083 family)
MDSRSERCATLAATWSWWGDTLTDLELAAWTRPTRLPGWDVAALAAHASLLVRSLQYLVAHPVDAEPTVHSSRELLTRFNEPGGLATTFASQVAEAARQQAASLPREDLVALFTVTAPEVVAAINAAGPIVVDYFGTARVPVEVPLSIATLEGVVHGLDLCASCDVSPASIPPSSMDHTVQLLASMAPPVAFIEAATGRRGADVLPVLR